MSPETIVSLGLGVWGAGLSTFISVRVIRRERRVDAEAERRTELINALDRLIRECRAFHDRFFTQEGDYETTLADYERWVADAESDIAKWSKSYATEFAAPDPRLAAFKRTEFRLKLLKDIRRAVLTPNSQLGPGE